MKQIEKTLSAARGGFTLIELLLVIAILGILATVVTTNLVGSTDDARIKATRTSISSLETSATTYKMNVGSWPSSVQDMKQRGGGDGSPVLDPGKSSKDAWGNEFQLRVVDGNFIEIRSAGPDGSMNTDDDITNRDSGK